MVVEKTFYILETSPGVYWSGSFVFRAHRIGVGTRIAAEPRVNPSIEAATPIMLEQWNEEPGAEPCRELLLEQYPGATLLRIKTLYQVNVAKEQSDGSFE